MKEPPKKSYSFYFNTNDWLGSQSVKLMSKAERGVYIQLLAIAWGGKQPGTLPASEDQVRRLAECTAAEWDEYGPAILPLFPLSECQTYRYNERLMLEVDKEKVKSEKAAASANKRWGKDADAMRTQCERNASASENNANASENTCERNAQVQEQVKKEQPMPIADSAPPASALVGSLPKAEPCPLTAQPGGKKQPGKGAPAEDQALGFAAFWQAYHGDCKKRASKTKAERKWNALPAKTRQHILAGVEGFRKDATRNGPDYLPYATTFLNEARWDNEGYGAAAVKPGLPPTKEFPADPRDLWGFNDPPVVQEPAPAYAAGHYKGTIR